MSSENIIHVNEGNFDYEVLAYSQNVPVLVDFWAEWCKPCKVLSPILEKLAEEGHGNIRLAKLDVDYNKSISIRYGVRSIPTVKAFLKGQVLGEFTGAIPEIKIREFIHTLAPSPADLILEKASSLLQANNWTDAEKAFEEALELDPGLPAATLGLIRCLLARGNSADSLHLIKRFPDSREFSQAEAMRPLAEIFNSNENMSYAGDDPLEAAMWNCLRLAKRGNLPSALDGLTGHSSQEQKLQKWHCQAARDRDFTGDG